MSDTIIKNKQITHIYTSYDNFSDIDRLAQRCEELKIEKHIGLRYGVYEKYIKSKKKYQYVSFYPW